MKKTLILLTMVFGFNSFAINCISVNNPAQNLKITNVGAQKVHAESFVRVLGDIYVGTVYNESFSNSVYTLFNQLGEKAVLTVKKKLSIGHHCRTRLCGTLEDPFESSSTAKLEVEGLEDEYFTCI